MKNRLQFNRHYAIYPTREDALTAFRQRLTDPDFLPLIGEPVVLRYKDSKDNLQLILAIGKKAGRSLDEREYHYIDTADLDERLAAEIAAREELDAETIKSIVFNNTNQAEVLDNVAKLYVSADTIPVGEDYESHVIPDNPEGKPHPIHKHYSTTDAIKQLDINMLDIAGKCDERIAEMSATTSDLSANTVAGFDQVNSDLEALSSATEAFSASTDGLLNNIKLGAGLEPDGTYEHKHDANFIDDATSLFEADEILDQVVADLSADTDAAVAKLSADTLAAIDELSANTMTADQALQAQIDELDGREVLGENAITVEVLENGSSKVSLLINEEDDKVLTQNALGLKTNLSLTYDSEAKKIYLNGKGNEHISEINAADFIKDGMLDSVSIITATEEDVREHPELIPGEVYLKLVFNTDAGKADVFISVKKLVDIYTVSATSLDYLTIEEYEIRANVGEGGLATYEDVKYVSGVTDNIIKAAGLNMGQEGTYPGHSGDTHIINNATSLDHADVLLDAAIYGVSGMVITLSGDVVSYIDEKTRGYDEKLEELDDKVAELSGVTREFSASTHQAIMELSARTFDPSEFYEYVDEHVEKLSGDVITYVDERVENLSGAVVDLSSKAITGITVDGDPVEPVDHVVNLHFDMPTVNSFFDGADYVSSAKTIIFTNSGNVVDSIDATDFIKDGMVDNVYISGGSMIISFNTEAGKEDIELALTDIFDPANYYTKAEIDELSASVVYNQTNINELSAGTVQVSGDIVTYINQLSADTDASIKALSAGTVQVSGDVVTYVNQLSADTDASIKALSAGTIQLSADTYFTIQELSASVVTNKTDLSELSASVVTNKTGIETLSASLIDDELVVSAAINDLNDRIGEISGSSVDLSNYYTKSEVYNKIEVDAKIASGGTFDPTNYYTKNDCDTKFETITNVAALSSATMTISSATHDKITALSAATTAMSSNLNTLSSATHEKITALSAATTAMSNDLNTLSSATHNKITALSAVTTAISKDLSDLSAVTITGVTLNDTPGVIENHVVKLTYSAPAGGGIEGVIVNGADAPLVNNKANIGTVLSAETQLSTAVTGDGNVFSSIQVSNHKITMGMDFTAATKANLDALSGAVKNNYYTTANTYNKTELYNKTEIMELFAASGGNPDAAISALTESLSALSSATYTHVTNNDIHVTVEDKKKWNDSSNSGASAYTMVLNLSSATVNLSASTTAISQNLNYLSAATTAISQNLVNLSSATVNLSAATTAISQNLDHLSAVTLTGVSMNGSEVRVEDHVAVLGSVITAETQLSSATTGTGNVFTDIAVDGHKVTMTKGMTVASSADTHSAIAAISGNIQSNYYTKTEVNQMISGVSSDRITGITMNGDEVSVANNVADLGTVITDETQLSSATTGTGNVVTNISVSGHQVTFAKDFSAASASELSTLSASVENNYYNKTEVDGKTKKTYAVSTSVASVPLNRFMTVINATGGTNLSMAFTNLPTLSSGEVAESHIIIENTGSTTMSITGFTCSNATVKMTPIDSTMYIDGYEIGEVDVMIVYNGSSYTIYVITT